MPPDTNAVDTFFKDLPSEDKRQADIFDDISSKNPSDKGVAEETSKEDEPRPNRRTRRLEQAYQRERESNIALTERIKVLTEVDKFNRDAGVNESSDVPSDWLRAYGDTPESRLAWQYNERRLLEVRAQAKEDALREVRDAQEQSAAMEREYEQFIDTTLENLEDSYNVDLTSDAPTARKARREFLTLLQSLSPKDDNGIVTDYADFDATWNLYQTQRSAGKSTETVNRAKDLSDRSMERSSSAAPQEQQPTAGFRGWEKDYNLRG